MIFPACCWQGCCSTIGKSEKNISRTKFEEGKENEETINDGYNDDVFNLWDN